MWRRTSTEAQWETVRGPLGPDEDEHMQPKEEEHVRPEEEEPMQPRRSRRIQAQKALLNA